MNTHLSKVCKYTKIVKKKNDILNNFIELKGNIDLLNKAISNYEFEKMNVDDLKNVLSFIYPNEDITNKVNKIMEAIMNETFDTDEELKLEIYNAIN